MAGRKKRIAIWCAIIIGICIALYVVAGIISGGFGERIGVVEIDGVITDGRQVMEDIVRFKEDKAIKGVIIRINSPGGSAAVSQEIYREIKKLKGKKKVYVSMGAVCASGGYYIAIAGEKIYAMPSTLTGSIGVIMDQIVLEDLLKRVGLSAHTIKSGPFKDAGSPFRKMKEEERAYFQGLVDDIYQQFVNAVASERRMSLERIRPYADGRVFTGKAAKDIGLIDTIGTFYDAVDDLKGILHIEGRPVLVYGKRPFSLIKWLMSSLLGEAIDSI